MADTVDVTQELNAAAGANGNGQPKKKILVIDDSPTIVDVVRHAIEQLRHDAVVVASDGVEGLEQFERERPDCVVVDVMMPQLDGFQLTRLLRGDSGSRQIPLIIMTTLGSADKRQTGLLSGADEYLVKPFTGHQLCEAIERVMAITPEERERRIKRLADGHTDNTVNTVPR